MSSLRIVLAHGSLVRYPEGGGNWMCFLQHFLGLRSLGHDVFWLAVVNSKGDRSKAELYIKIFFERMNYYGLGNRCIVLLHDNEEFPSLKSASPYGKSMTAVEELIRTTDLLWNYSYSLKSPLLCLFKRRVLIDLDPGIFQIAALTQDMGQNEHDAFLTVGSKLHDSDCEAPTLGLTWHTFAPLIYLPLWKVVDPPRNAPFTSVTEWNWGSITYRDKQLNLGKRDAYEEYITLPKRTKRPFKLAANIPDEIRDDRELLSCNGWHWVNPHVVANSPFAYQEYIKRSQAEICCPKPIYSELKTGWLSDRSAAYLASGRPVLMRETGVSDHLPTGLGLITFQNLEEAVAGVQNIEANYKYHSHAAREFAEEFLDSEKCLTYMLSVCY